MSHPLLTIRDEAEVKREIKRALERLGVLHLRVNSGSLLIGENGRRRKIQMAPPGTADFVAWVGHHTLWIEAKSSKGRQSPDQRVFQTQVQAHGHYYAIARDAETVAGWVKSLRTSG